ncbi:hypothetical protein [Litorimonas sp.]|uniref:hypothetical protein n=1 Tax=Litorimonas sp. TaxID=1892381 RepID=UPI003A86C7BD
MTLPTSLASALSQIDSALRYIPAPNKGEVSGPLVNAKKCMESVKNSLENYAESLSFDVNIDRTIASETDATTPVPTKQNNLAKGGQDA